MVGNFLVDLIALPFHEFDFILGMDWLSKHRAIIDCDKKTVVLRCSDQFEVIVHGVRWPNVQCDFGYASSTIAEKRM